MQPFNEDSMEQFDRSYFFEPNSKYEDVPRGILPATFLQQLAKYLGYFDYFMQDSGSILCNADGQKLARISLEIKSGNYQITLLQYHKEIERDALERGIEVALTYLEYMPPKVEEISELLH